MTNFQGSGFSLDIPKDVQDKSVYTFVLPSDESFTPYITIKFETVPEEHDLLTYSETNENLLKDNVENFESIDRIAGKHDGKDVAISNAEWGENEGRIHQRFVYFYDAGEKYQRIYTITCIALANNFKDCEPYMNHFIKSFKPNENQIFDT